MNWKRRNDFDYKYELLKDEFNKDISGGTMVVVEKHNKKKPTPEELFNNWLWDEETKTGVNRFSEETLKKLIVLDGKPEYPIHLGDDFLPVLEKIYDWE